MVWHARCQECSYGDSNSHCRAYSGVNRRQPIPQRLRALAMFDDQQIEYRDLSLKRLWLSQASSNLASRPDELGDSLPSSKCTGVGAVGQQQVRLSQKGRCALRRDSTLKCCHPERDGVTEAEVTSVVRVRPAESRIDTTFASRPAPSRSGSGSPQAARDPPREFAHQQALPLSPV